MNFYRIHAVTQKQSKNNNHSKLTTEQSWHSNMLTFPLLYLSTSMIIKYFIFLLTRVFVNLNFILRTEKALTIPKLFSSNKTKIYFITTC